ncbi:hypothetical protein ABI59_09115 [Acidobacteria bacterium Mor1]|nr:hypothetical protein ABI59_09115 [Acidobacteria bacterium Mor1]
MNLERMQQALRDAGVDGWLFYDFHHRDLMAYRILGLDTAEMASRRWFYFMPAQGEPVRLCHKVEPRKLDSLPGRQEFYLAWTELHEKLRQILSGVGKLAMQYSPMCNIPYVSVVDAGTIELIRSMGPEVVSSAGLVQQFEAVTDQEGLDSHRRAGDKIHEIKNEAFLMMSDALREGRAVTEFEVQQHIVQRFAEEGLYDDDEHPIVGFNDHPADPHFQPTAENAYTLKAGDTILLDLWARETEPPGIFYDVTWCAYAGTEPPAEYVKIWNTVCAARDAAIELVRERFGSGTPCHGYEVDQACRDVVVREGYGEHFLHRTGHSIGIKVHGNGANIDNLETKDDRLLVPGICFSIEPGIYLPGKMAVRTEVDMFIGLDGVPEIAGPVQKDLILFG